MINHPVLLRSYLAGVSAITDLTGTRIYALRNTPPENYLLSDGQAITFKPRGGRQDESGCVHTVSYQFKCYAETELLSYDLYRTLYDNMDGKHPSGTQIAQIVQEVEGQPQTELEGDVEWHFTLAFFEIKYKNSG